ncbi:M1 family metallopeptidase [Fulvivirga sediminis]|uniref:M1 family metallopeptidase n=1 Tax=Fulvivirga sediminis TaxID=2803949 RepID=A0A937F5W6_9BACT|nr:M1 family metallopeptidase [Fulvivirga sediminis]MBL3655229.1 M1 family metallopeptidase [Fulvivirga sediminis]
MKKPYLLLALLCFNILAFAQDKSLYDYHEAFSPSFYTTGGNLFRSADGRPGPEYWQNSANYNINAKFNPSTQRLSGIVTIDYTNESPNRLDQLWLQLVHNGNKKDSRGAAMQGSYAEEDGSNGFTIKKVEIQQGNSWEEADFRIIGTCMHIRLKDATEAEGGKIKIRIDYDFLLAERGRSGYMDSENGEIFEVAYWYPRMCVYDDLRGWNTLPFLGSGEFYLDYGDIDYTVLLPEGYLMAGSGELMNPEETLTTSELKQYEKAKTSDETVMIRSKKDLKKSATQKGKDGWVSWHYTMKNTRDVAWAASKAFMWDAVSANLPDGKSTLAMSYYPVESAGDKAWGRASEFLKRSLEIFSEKWFVYPYPAAINVGGPVGGMEYPGITFDSYKAAEYTLFLLVSHEIGHNWFPMIVGTNERRDAWMDEGFNTFIDIYAHEEYNNGEFSPKRDGEYAPGGGNPANEIIPIITKEGAQPVMSKADALRREDVHPLEYFKSAYGLVLLREVILTHDQFDYAFQKYTHEWAYKHPSPEDFFKIMNSYTGEELNWFWKGWFIENWKLDQEIIKVDNEKDQKEITIKNNEKMPMPVLLKVTLEGGEEKNYHLPVEVWMQGNTYTFKDKFGKNIIKAELDPEKQLPDINRDNNIWSK